MSTRRKWRIEISDPRPDRTSLKMSLVPGVEPSEEHYALTDAVWDAINSVYAQRRQRRNQKVRAYKAGAAK